MGCLLLAAGRDSLLRAATAAALTATGSAFCLGLQFPGLLEQFVYSQFQCRQIAFNDIPNQFKIDAKVIMN